VDGGHLDDPDGSDVYSWYRTAVDLLESGSAAAAVQLLRRAVAAEPSSPSLREALARAEFDAGWYAASAESFRRLLDAAPDNDYGLFGLGLAESRLGEFQSASEHLALAVAMRPDSPHYAQALRQVRATLRAREEQHAASDAGEGSAEGPGQG
jgi:predicted Zn-dependent protease